MQVNGTERLGWDQRAADTVELGTFQYVIYVDDVRVDATNVSCATSASETGFACSAALPPMTSGEHVLSVAAFVVDDSGSRLESEPSASLRVTVTGAGTATANGGDRVWPQAVMTADGVTLRVERVADGLDRPTALAFTPDGRQLVVERSGRARFVRDGQVQAGSAFAPGDQPVVALAVDPDFARTRFVYAVGAGGSSFWLARFREAGGTLAERAVLLDEIGAVHERTAALRFGPDGTLLAAFEEGPDPQAAGDLASPNGKILRLTREGTTPVDQAGATPVYASGFHSPRGLDWDPLSGTLWVADVESTATSTLSVVTRARGPGTRGIVGRRYALPPGAGPSSIAFYRGDRVPRLRGNLLVASEEAQMLMRLRTDPRDWTRVERVEHLLAGQVGAIRVVASGPDGAIYFCTTSALGRLVPD
jgi:glucose/arabinose dehydrogenase